MPHAPIHLGGVNLAEQDPSFWKICWNRLHLWDVWTVYDSVFQCRQLKIYRERFNLLWKSRKWASFYYAQLSVTLIRGYTQNTESFIDI